MKRPNILLVTKGHPFEKDAFFSIFDSIDVDYTHVEQPAARVFFNPELAQAYDALVMYDMPGIAFGANGPEWETPTEAYKEGLLALLEQGKGMVFMHHAIAGWPAWPEYAEIVGGRFLYLPQELRGQNCQDSGYRHQVEHQLSIANDELPEDIRASLASNVPDQFQMTDELYLYEVFNDSITPMLKSDYSFNQGNFYSATKAVRDGKMFDNEGWVHKPGSNTVGWIKTYGNSPIAYIQGGDDPAAYENSHYRQLLENTIRWAASSEALDWAKEL